MASLQIILGCYGQQGIGDFVFCHGASNAILEVDKNLKAQKELFDLLDEYGLFDYPISDWNKVRALLFKIQEKCTLIITKSPWSKVEFFQLEKFTLMHKSCGCYIKLTQIGKSQHIIERPISKITNKPIEPTKIFIQGRGANQWQQDKNKAKN